MSRKTLFLVLMTLALLMVVSLSAVSAQDDVRITLVLNGVLGDKSFFDSAQRGADRIADEYGIDVNTVELGIDPANWEPGLNDVMADSDSYDILIAGTFQMIDFLAAR
ncbi:MAG: BMP family ABC transporter substrate-binding protein, partial [Anaerolineae bacterium]|nr:BMP family ABC transporter substrate-binding protein [Anaerolineae bacterium]